MAKHKDGSKINEEDEFEENYGDQEELKEAATEDFKTEEHLIEAEVKGSNLLE